jgi:hypothetical protein
VVSSTPSYIGLDCSFDAISLPDVLEFGTPRPLIATEPMRPVAVAVSDKAIDTWVLLFGFGGKKLEMISALVEILGA